MTSAALAGVRMRKKKFCSGRKRSASSAKAMITSVCGPKPEHAIEPEGGRAAHGEAVPLVEDARHQVAAERIEGEHRYLPGPVRALRPQMCLGDDGSEDVAGDFNHLAAAAQRIGSAPRNGLGTDFQHASSTGITAEAFSAPPRSTPEAGATVVVPAY